MPKRRSVPNIIEFTTDGQLLGLSLSLAQETLLRGIYGLPLPTEDHRATWALCTGGRPYREGHQVPEVTLISGARGGKDSRIAAPVLTCEAVYGGHERHLSRGERATIPLVSQDARANAVARGYVFSYLRESPVLKGLVEDEKRDELHLSNGVSVVCFPNTSASLRAWSMPVGGMNEIGFWRLEGAADSDVEIQAAIRRGMVGFERTLLLKCSTPYMRGGLLFADFERAFGQDDPDLLVWRAPSRLMNPTLSEARLAREQRLDPVRYQREYLAEWIEDVATAFAWPWIEAAANRDRPQEYPVREAVRYRATTDPTGGGDDAWPLLIYHVEGDGAEARLIVDVLRSRRRAGGQSPDLEGTVAEYCDVLRRYGCDAVCGDRYAAGWVRQAFERHSIRYVEASTDRSGAYLELTGWLAQGRVEIPDHPALVRELRNLERRTRPGGKDAVDHPRGQHDDHANVLALAAAESTRAGRVTELKIVGGYSTPYEGLDVSEVERREAEVERIKREVSEQTIADSIRRNGWWTPGGW